SDLPAPRAAAQTGLWATAHQWRRFGQPTEPVPLGECLRSQGVLPAGDGIGAALSAGTGTDRRSGADRARSGWHRRSHPWAAGGDGLSWVLWAISIPPVVGLRWGDRTAHHRGAAPRHRPCQSWGGGYPQTDRTYAAGAVATGDH